jgi:hypothetical protein
MAPNSFMNCKKQPSENDLCAIERALNVQLPVDIKQHHLRNNGGKPACKLWTFAAEAPAGARFPNAWFKALPSAM